MSRASDYEHWEHEAGYRLNADGKRLKYVNEAAGLTLFVEAEVEGDNPEMQYRVWLQDEDRENVVYPEPFTAKESALERLDELMKEYNEPTP